MITEFKLNDKEIELAEEFKKEHYHPDIYKGAIGGHINYIFTPTSIGDAVSIECSICSEIKNITDYDSW